MPLIDRRTGRERRIAERHRVTIDVEWESMSGRKTGTVNDISSSGCFIVSSFAVEDGENIKIFFPLSDGTSAQFWAKVMNHVFEVGFGAKFMGLTEAQTDYLEKFIDTLKED